MKNYEESRLQQQFVAWFRAQYPQYAMLLTHPINEGSGHSEADRRRQGIHKAEGAVAGVSDILFFMPAKYWDGHNITHGLCIEFKTEKGKQSQEQKNFEKMITAAGYGYKVARSAEAARKLINDYIAHIPETLRREVAATHVEIKQAAEQKEKERFYKIIGKK